MTALRVVALLLLPLVASAETSRSLHRIAGEVLERHGTEYVVIEGEAAPLVGTGGLLEGSLIVVLEPDPRAGPGPGTSYVGYGLYVGRLRGVASNDVELPAFRAVSLFEIYGRCPHHPAARLGR